jgi:hypothetical protein
VREALEKTGLTVEAVGELGERVHPDTGRRIAYVACTVIGGVAHAASPREVSAAALVRDPVGEQGSMYQCPNCKTLYTVTRKPPGDVPPSTKTRSL